MSTPPPPPPPPSPFGQQPPQQQYGAPPPAYTAPPGYVPYGSPMQAQVKPSKGLSTAMVALFALTTAASVLLAYALLNRQSVVDDFIAGDAGIVEVDDADNFAGLSLMLMLMVVLAAAIVTCLWSKRIADNAKAKGALNINPGLAAGGWFIPIGNLFVGFDQLRKSVRGVGGNSPSLAIWQGFFIAELVALIAINRLGQFSANDLEGVSDQLGNQGIAGIAGALMWAGATVFGARAAKEINGAVTGG